MYDRIKSIGGRCLVSFGALGVLILGGAPRITHLWP